MMAWALFCHDFDLSKGINILSEKCPVVLDHYVYFLYQSIEIEALYCAHSINGNWETAHLHLLQFQD